MTWPYANQFPGRLSYDDFMQEKARRQNELEGKQHYCVYMLMRRTIKMTGSHQQWVERCMCGRMKVVDWNMIHDGANSPAMIKHWYDSDGNCVKKTGKVSASDIEIASKIRADIDYSQPLENEA